MNPPPPHRIKQQLCLCLLKTPKAVNGQEFCDSRARRLYAHFAYQSSESAKNPDSFLLLSLSSTRAYKLICRYQFGFWSFED